MSCRTPKLLLYFLTSLITSSDVGVSALRPSYTCATVVQAAACLTGTAQSDSLVVTLIPIHSTQSLIMLYNFEIARYAQRPISLYIDHAKCFGKRAGTDHARSAKP